MAMAEVAPLLTPELRRVQFAWPEDQTDKWHHSMPEFGAGANAISLLMTYAEPYGVGQMRKGLVDIDADEELTERAQSLMSQEMSHLRAHKAFNKALISHSRTARVLDRVGKWIFGRLAKRSTAFGVAFAAAFEIVAFASARWAEAGLRQYFTGADEQSATLFLWHLAEEIEHKGIAHDLLLAHPEASKKYKFVLPVAFAVLIGFTAVGGLSLFAFSRHVFNPIRWARLIGWGISFAFVVMPVASTSLARGFHPDQLVDPPWMKMWLREYDEVSQTMPLWTDAGLGASATTTLDGATRSAA